MKRLDYFNLLGVLALAVLCITQWQRNRALNLEINRLQKEQFDQAARLAEKEQTSRGLNDDLKEIKEQFTKAQAALDDARQKVRTSDHNLRQITIERDQLKTNVTNWAAAVTARDERLEESTAQSRRLTDELNASIRKFNDLATNYNAVVKDLNKLRTPLKP